MKESKATNTNIKLVNAKAMNTVVTTTQSNKRIKSL